MIKNSKVGGQQNRREGNEKVEKEKRKARN